MASKWYWDDNKYKNPPSTDLIVYPNQEACAKSVIDYWKAGTCERVVLVKAQMQVGKTGVIRHICYLLNNKQEMKYLMDEKKYDASEDYVYILSSISSTALLGQTRSRMAGVLNNPTEQIFHPAGDALNTLASQEQLRKNRVLIIDESHWGSGENQEICKFLEKIQSSYEYDDETFEQMQTANTWVVLVSATPFLEELNGEMHTIVLTPPVEYYGVQKMLSSQKIEHHIAHKSEGLNFDSLDSEAVGRAFYSKVNSLEKFKKNKNGFVLIRENDTPWVSNLQMFITKNVPENEMVYVEFHSKVKKFLASYVDKIGKTSNVAKDCKRVQSNTNCDDLDAVLGTNPDRIVVIFIKDALRAGKTVDTTNVLMVIDTPLKNVNDQSAMDTTVQGLVGRCCGNKKQEDDVLIITNKPEVENYKHWLETGEIISKKPSGRMKVDENGNLIAVNSAYVSQNREMKKIMWKMQKLFGEGRYADKYEPVLQPKAFNEALLQGQVRFKLENSIIKVFIGEIEIIPQPRPLNVAFPAGEEKKDP
eukprot:gene9125-9895_t